MPEFKATSSDIGVRADIFIAKQYPSHSRSALEGLFSGHKVTAGGQPVKPSHKIIDGEALKVDDELITAEPEAIDLPVIYEDENVLVINKPAGVLTHSKGALNTEGTVASFIRPKVDKSLVGNWAGIVHRLDRPTSGVIITAKNRAAQSWLQKQFSTRKTKKTYLAVIEGQPKLNQAIIDAPIARNSKKPQTFCVNPEGKPAQTEYRVIKLFQAAGKTYSLVELKPLTGRTHQIRVHLAYIGHPVAGDAVYGRQGEHLLLHAAKLELTLPGGVRQVFSAPEPDYFSEFIKS